MYHSEQEHSDPFSTFVFLIVRQMLITAIARVCQRVYYRDPLPTTEVLSHFVALAVISTLLDAAASCWPVMQSKL